MVKESTCSAGDSRDARSIPGAGRSPGEGNGNLFSTLVWRIPWTWPGGLQFMEGHRVRHDWALMHTPILIASLLKRGCMEHTSRHFLAQGPASQCSPSGKKLPSWAVMEEPRVQPCTPGSKPPSLGSGVTPSFQDMRSPCPDGCGRAGLVGGGGAAQETGISLGGGGMVSHLCHLVRLLSVHPWPQAQSCRVPASAFHLF